MRYFLEMSYDGTQYGGWQIQPNRTTIQEVVEKTLSVVLKAKICTIVAGRTDAGVHAFQQFAHFDYPSSLPRRFFDACNSILPCDISIEAVYLANKHINARFDALRRTYEYHITTQKSTFQHRFSIRIFNDVSIEKLNYAAEIIRSYKDFAALSKKHGSNKTTTCDIYYARWTKTETGMVFTVTANRFLWGMVRAMVGLMLAFGNGKVSEYEFKRALNSETRLPIANSVSPKGLFLKSIEYPENSFILLANHQQRIVYGKTNS